MCQPLQDNWFLTFTESAKNAQETIHANLKESSSQPNVFKKYLKNQLIYRWVMFGKVPYRLFPLTWHGVKIILRDERLFNVGLSWSVFQGHIFSLFR